MALSKNPSLAEFFNSSVNLNPSRNVDSSWVQLSTYDVLFLAMHMNVFLAMHMNMFLAWHMKRALAMLMNMFLAMLMLVLAVIRVLAMLVN